MTDDSCETTEDNEQAEFRILESLITNQNMTPEQAVQEIIRITRVCKARSFQLGNHCCSVAGGLLWAAAHTAPDDQHKLVSFFHKLRSMTVADLSTGGVLEYEDNKLWKDLPTFGYTFADELHSIPSPYPTPNQITHWLNTLSFIAQLDASTCDPNLDFTHTWALAFITCAIDRETDERFGGNEVAVKLACVWYIYDAEKLWSKVPETVNFTLTNWQRWKRGLKERRDAFEGWEEKSWCERALAEIRRVESEI